MDQAMDKKQLTGSEALTSLLDAVKKLVVVSGGIMLVVLSLGIAYVSNPDAINGLIDSLLF